MVKKGIGSYILLFGSFVIYSFVSVFSKLAATQETLMGTLFFMGLEVVTLGIYAIAWQQVLKRFSLIKAMSSKGITVIISMLWAVLLFREHITVQNIIGAVLIMIGIGLVSTSD